MSAEVKEGNIAETCQRSGMSRQSAYEVMERHRKENYVGVRALSLAPPAKPRATSEAVEETVLELRRKGPNCWPTKPKAYWGRLGGAKGKAKRHRMASASSIRDVRIHEELTVQRAKRPGGQGRINEALEQADETSLARKIDYERPFTTSNCRRCTQLRLSNRESCSLLMRVAMSGIQTKHLWASVEALFRENKLSAAIQLDSQTPFGRSAPVCSTKLSLYWERLESRHDGIEPTWRHRDRRHGCFHSDILKGGVTCDPSAQERIFEGNQCELNEALDIRTLRVRYRTGEQRYVSQSQEFEFGEGLQSPRLLEQITILWAAERIPISPARRRESVGLDKEKADHDLSVACGRVFQGCLQVRTSILIVTDPAELLEKKNAA